MPGPLAKLMMAAAALVVASLFAYLAWQAATAPADARPRAEVLGVEEQPDGSVLVQVAVVNHASRGLVEVVVEVDCDDPAPEIAFTNVPASGRRVGFVSCPAGTSAPQASVATFRAA